jgi:branched-subunit amino acid transport protein
MSHDVIVLIIAMGGVTYVLRAGPLLLAASPRWIELATPHLRLVAPAALSALAAISALIGAEGGREVLRINTDTPAILVGIALAAWRNNVAVGIVGGTVLAVILRILLN